MAEASIRSLTATPGCSCGIRPRRPVRCFVGHASHRSARYRLRVPGDTTERLSVTAESDQLVVFGDGMEHDAIRLTWGQRVEIGIAAQRLRLVE